MHVGCFAAGCGGLRAGRDGEQDTGRLQEPVRNFCGIPCGGGRSLPAGLHCARGEKVLLCASARGDVAFQRIRQSCLYGQGVAPPAGHSV